MTITVLDNMEYGSDAAARATYSSSGIILGNIKSLLHFNGDNNSTNILDDSKRGWVAYGNAKISTSQSVLGGSSLYLDKSSLTRIQTPHSSELVLGSQNFTIVMRVYPTNISASWQSLWSKRGSQNNTKGLLLGIDASGQLYMWASSNNTSWDIFQYVVLATGLSTNNWYEIALVRNGNSWYGFKNGVHTGTAYSSATLSDAGHDLCIGGDTDGCLFGGYIDEYALYTSSVLYPLNSAQTSEFSSDSNTKLLLHFNGDNNSTTFIDSEGTPKTITPNGNAKISTDQYKFGSASGYFDGSGDYLTAPFSSDFQFGTGDFTVEAWVRMPNPTTGEQCLFCGYQTGELNFGTNGTLIGVGRIGIAWDLQVTHGIQANTWTHLALTRKNGLVSIYVNYALIGSKVLTNSYNLNSTAYIGAQGSGYYYSGYIDELRVSNVCRFDIDYTPETSEFSIDATFPLVTYSEPTTITEGSYSLKATAAQTTSLNKTLTRTISSPINLTGYSYIIGKIRSNRTGSNIKLGFHDSGGTTTEVIPNITASDTWQNIQLDISGVSDANKDAINQIIITVVNADYDTTFYLDMLWAFSGLSEPLFNEEIPSRIHLPFRGTSRFLNYTI